jgi:hypothetical protein
MPRSTILFALLLLAPLASSACGSDDPVTPTEPEPVAVTETFSGTLSPNGGRTYSFAVARAGTITAKISALAPDDTVKVGLAIGTWNGAVCAQSIPNDSATLNTTVVGTAQQTGQFCARIYDALGTLTASADFTLEVTHF